MKYFEQGCIGTDIYVGRIESLFSGNTPKNFLKVFFSE